MKLWLKRGLDGNGRSRPWTSMQQGDGKWLKIEESQRVWPGGPNRNIGRSWWSESTSDRSSTPFGHCWEKCVKGGRHKRRRRWSWSFPVLWDRWFWLNVTPPKACDQIGSFSCSQLFKLTEAVWSEHRFPGSACSRSRIGQFGLRLRQDPKHPCCWRSLNHASKRLHGLQLWSVCELA